MLKIKPRRIQKSHPATGEKISVKNQSINQSTNKMKKIKMRISNSMGISRLKHGFVS